MTGPTFQFFQTSTIAGFLPRIKLLQKTEKKWAFSLSFEGFVTK